MMNDETKKTEAAGAPHEDYAERIEARKLRYLGRADNANRLAADLRVSANHMADAIPFGQPILIGHHSEGRDRRFRQRMHDKGMKSVEQDRKAAHYAQRAHSVGRGGISSDDPEAPEKLRQKVQTAREAQELMKSINRIVRSKAKTDDQKVAEIVAKGLPEKGARKLLEGDMCGRVGYPDYALKNNLANIKRMEARIAEIERERSAPAVEEARGEVTYREAENRVILEFPDKPPREVRQRLRAHGFHWSRSRGAWVRKLNNAARHAGRAVLSSLREE